MGSGEGGAVGEGRVVVPGQDIRAAWRGSAARLRRRRSGGEARKEGGGEAREAAAEEGGQKQRRHLPNRRPKGGAWKNQLAIKY